MTVLRPDLAGLAYAMSGGGTIGGSVLTDTENFFEQAALYYGWYVELIPRLPGKSRASSSR